METEIRPYMCRKFTEFDELKPRDNPNFVLGDGTCPKFQYVIHERTTICPRDCQFYEALKINQKELDIE